MPISIDISDCNDEVVLEAAFDRLRAIDRRFSTYKKDSEVCRLKRAYPQKSSIPRFNLGMEWSKELKMIVKACQKAEKRTDGWFSAWAAGAFDPSGYVKGWAIAEAGKVIEAQGHTTYCIGAGGDILAKSAGEKLWNIGIQDPRDPKKLLDLNKLAPLQIPSGAVGNRIAEHRDFAMGLSISNGAVCTSGNYERGAHIINPKTKKPATGFLSVTVTGPDVITADILATAVFVAGPRNPAFMKNFPEYRAIVVDKNKLK